MSHYFENDLNLISEQRLVEFKLNDKLFSFISDNGVFSKNKLDFGSKLLISTMLKLKPKGKILDLGCGIGVIGLTLASFDNNNYTFVDINERAVELTKQNIKKLGLTSRCEAKVSDSFSGISRRKFDYILFNPPIRTGKAVIYKMYTDALEHLNSNGSLVIVIRIKQGAISSYNYLITLFSKVEVINKDKGYQILRCVK